MATNFDFLRSNDKNLYEIISDAEKLYRDEYFEQCMGQTRRFAENICKKVLGSKRTTEETFDQMLATLKDNAKGSEQEKEFIDDLYFLKKCGNQSVHSSSVKKDGINALECLQRSFEVAINYAVYHQKCDKKVLNLHYDIELLATGKQDKTLAQRYSQAKRKLQIDDSKKTSAKKSVKKTKTTKSSKLAVKNKKVKSVQQSKVNSYPPKKSLPIYWIFVGVCSFISLVMALFLTFTK